MSEWTTSKEVKETEKRKFESSYGYRAGKNIRNAIKESGKRINKSLDKKLKYRRILKPSKTVYAVQARKPAKYKRIFFKS